MSSLIRRMQRKRDRNIKSGITTAFGSRLGVTNPNGKDKQAREAREAREKRGKQ